MSDRNQLPSLFGNPANGDDLFKNLHAEINKVFGQFRHGWPGLPMESDSASNDKESMIPRVNIAESDEAVEIEAELPGFKAEDVEVTSRERTLIIQASRSSSSDEKKKSYHVMERSTGSYQRVIPLEFDIDPDSVQARCKDGVLTVTVAKPAEVAQKQVKIEVESA